jgi:hypothetical protein
MISHSETITSLMGAMLQVQGAVDGVRKDSKNPHFRSSYASLEAVVDTIRPACQAAGLVVMQAPGAYADGVIHVETMIAHAKSGEWIKGTVGVPVQKQDPQGVGSALTYAERYSLMAMFNLPPVDDDGEAAVSRPAGNAQRAVAAREAAPAPVEDPMAEVERNMLATIANMTDPNKLDRLAVSARFSGDLAHLPDDRRGRVEKALRTRRDTLANPVMAG